MAYGHYRRIGLTECVAKDAGDYVDIAVKLGTDPDWRHDVEARIVAASPVRYDNVDGIKELEALFRTAANEASAGGRESPDRQINGGDLVQ